MIWHAYTQGFLFFFTLLGAFTVFMAVLAVIMLIACWITEDWDKLFCKWGMHVRHPRFGDPHTFICAKCGFTEKY